MLFRKFSTVAAIAIVFSVGLGLAQEKEAIVRVDPKIDQIIPAGAKLEKVAGNLGFAEGPVWDRKHGYLIFTDIRADAVNKYNPKTGQVAKILDRSGSGGRAGTPSTPQGGANGSTLDKQGRLILCAQGDLQIERIEKDGKRTVLASEFEGKRLNRTNDVIVKSDGSIYFSDPLPGGSAPMEMGFNGIFRIKNGKVDAIVRDNPAPNGLVFSPDEKVFYTNATAKRLIFRYDVNKDGTVTNGKTFFDMNGHAEIGGPDGMKVDNMGNLYSTGPGGMWIISPEGKHLGTILTPEQASNGAWGDADGKTLYITARTGIYRIRLNVQGVRP